MQEQNIISPIKSNELCSLSMVRRVAAMLDLDSPSFSNGDVLPRGWHFFMLAGETQKSALRADGFPGLGVPIPDLGLPRLLLGGRTVSYQGDIMIGAAIERSSFIKNISEKTTNSGRMAIVTLQHELYDFLDKKPLLTETQTYILLSEKSGQAAAAKENIEPINASFQKKIIPDETFLFQYSALGFNSHKIHWDRNYAQNVEGLPDLVVNGGLATLLLTEFIRNDLKLTITDIKVKHIAPLFCNRPMTLAADNNGTNWQLKIYDDNNKVAVEMETKLTY
jgi:3-methylfumaryl-CoA hydratase